MKLTVVIVSYNVRCYLEQCLDSVLKATSGMEAEVWVVDNHSHDDTVKCLHERFQGKITLVESTHNLGFARANNLAIRKTTGEYVLLLNPDTIVAEDTLRRVISFMDAYPQAGGAGVMMLGGDGMKAPESRRALPTPWVSFMKMLGFARRYYMSHLSWDEAAPIEVMSGAFCMLRRSVLGEIGLLDKDFFMYGEDIDLSYRITLAGYENWYVPAVMIHYKGESTKKSSFRYVHVFYQAMLIFFKKHYGHLSLFVTLPIRLAIYFRATLALLQVQYWRLRHSMGFFERHAVADEMPVYAFVGSWNMQEECRLLANRRGLTATFYDDLGQVTDQNVCVVYDTEAYTYAQIIADMRQRAHRGRMMGTYSTRTHVLITPKEIFQ